MSAESQWILVIVMLLAAVSMIVKGK